MKRVYILMFLLYIVMQISLMGQEKEQDFKYRNYLTASYGPAEYSFNYERNLFNFQRSYSNIRAGLGEWSDLNGDWTAYNLSLVYLTGKQKSSHLESNAGVRYIRNDLKDAKFLYPDIFVGYRFENPEGWLLLRGGFSLISLFNLGAGIKF
jgi:hypothetical protein